MDFYTLGTGTGIYLCTGIIFIKIFVKPMLFVSHQSTGTFFLLLLTMKESYVFSGVINKKKFLKISQNPFAKCQIISATSLGCII